MHHRVRTRADGSRKNYFRLRQVLSRQDFDGDGLREKMRHYTPKVLAFTSKRAAAEFVGRPVEYGRLEDMIGPTKLFVLPSPSGAARRYWSQRPWPDLANLAQ
jgi:TDG/mug DNA glycosylase family protein